MIESYNLIMLDQFQGYYKNENSKDNELKERSYKLEKEAGKIAMAKKELFA